LKCFYILIKTIFNNIAYYWLFPELLIFENIIWMRIQLQFSKQKSERNKRNETKINHIINTLSNFIIVLKKWLYLWLYLKKKYYDAFLFSNNVYTKW